VATLMAHIEGEQHGDKGRVREWLARAVNAPRDPAWTADGVVADRWAPISPVTGTLDAFQWRVPVESMDRGDGEMLAAKLEELVALGGPEGGSPPDEAAARKKVDDATTIEVVPVTEPKSARETRAQKSEPVAKAPADKPTESPKKTPSAKPAAESAPTARQSTREASVPPTASTRTKGQGRSDSDSGTRRKPEPRIFVAPPAPDDPGPESEGQDDIGPPLRPKPA